MIEKTPNRPEERQFWESAFHATLEALEPRDFNSPEDYVACAIQAADYALERYSRKFFLSSCFCEGNCEEAD